VDDAVVRWWRVKRVLDGSYCDARTRGESRQRAFLVAYSRRWSYRRRLVADAAYVRNRSCADSPRGAHAIPWVDIGLGLAPVFAPRSRDANVCLRPKNPALRSPPAKFAQSQPLLPAHN